MENEQTSPECKMLSNTDKLIEILQDLDADIRSSATDMLCKIRDARVAIKSMDEHVRDSAAYALSKIQDAQRAVTPSFTEDEEKPTKCYLEWLR